MGSSESTDCCGCTEGRTPYIDPFNQNGDAGRKRPTQLRQQTKCTGTPECSCLKRIVTTLSYYNTISSMETHKLIEYCNKYNQSYLEDYIDVLSNHQNHLNIIQQMTNDINTCSGVNGCLKTRRHFRDRNTNQNESTATNLCIDIFDTLHFYLNHMEECGLRVSITQNVADVDSKNDDYNSKKYSDFRDGCIDAIQKEIQAKKSKCTSFERLDNMKNTKFNIMQNNLYKTEDKTFTDNMFEHIHTASADKVAKSLKTYVQSENYDTDSIQYEIDIYESENDCNLVQAVNYDIKIIWKIRQFCEMVNLSRSSFSTGFVFWYWNFYKHATYDQIKQRQPSIETQNDFGGHTVEELFVEAKFDSLKQEALNFGIRNFQQKVVAKGNSYFVTEKCKKIRCIEQDDSLHFGIAKDASLKRSHLYALVLYCDFTNFCTSFSGTFRRRTWSETVKCVANRNSQYFHISKNLKEVIQYYGINNSHSNNGTESGPFYSGLSFVLNIPEFCIRLCGPTSTTRQKEIAIKFATRSGMLIQLNNQFEPACLETFFNVSWLSTYPEEAERLFCGGRYKIELETVIVIKSTHNYNNIIKIFSKFDQCLSGGAGLWGMNATKQETEIMSWFIKFCLGEVENIDRFDEFIKNTFLHFIQMKTQIVLDMYLLSSVRNKNFIGLFLNKIENTFSSRGNKIPSISDNKNLFSPCILRIFQNLKEIVIYSSTYNGSVYSFNIFILLSILDNVSLKPTIIVKDTYPKYNGEWLNCMFSSRVQQKYLHKNLQIKLKRNQGSDKNEDWIIINPSPDQNI